MNVSKKRQLVIDYIRTQRIRKRAPIIELLCRNCGRRVDFVSLSEAAKLFELDPEELLNFISANACHFTISPTGDVHICLTTFLSAMRSRSNNFKLIEGELK